MAKRHFVTGAMIIAAGAVTSAANATQAVSKNTGLIGRATGQLAVSSIIHLDEDITTLGGLRAKSEFLTASAHKGDSLSMAPIIANPIPTAKGVNDTLKPGLGIDPIVKKKPPAVPGRQDSLTKPPAVQGIRQDTLRPPVVPRVRRTVPRTAVPSGSNKP